MLDEEAVQQRCDGVLIRGVSISDAATAHQAFLEQAVTLGISHLVDALVGDDGQSVRFRLCMAGSSQVSDAHDTLQLCQNFKLNPQRKDSDLVKEIFLSMLMGPITFEYPNYQEFAASIRIRANLVKAARQTALAFHTSKIERPADYWAYSEECGFTVLTGKSLIDALRKATQPDLSGQKYSFSCYRATEYVILLAIAQELEKSNPLLLQRLQLQWESQAIMSRQFHDVFLREFGSMSEPLPPRYCVPGDRLWFRNPDEASSEVTGYEGSWVFYLGGGLFTNFWEPDKPFTLASKCIEIYHWRHGVYQGTDGNFHMNESIAQAYVRATMRDPIAVEQVLDQMMRLRDPQGVYAEGGCIDATRECPRWVCQGTSDMILPALQSL